jgi:hypothetical protein
MRLGARCTYVIAPRVTVKRRCAGRALRSVHPACGTASGTTCGTDGAAVAPITAVVAIPASGSLTGQSCNMDPRVMR